MTTEERDQLFAWAHAHLEGALTAEDHAALEALVRRDTEARRMFADLLHDHASLYWDHVGETEAEVITFPGEARPAPFPNPLLSGIAAGFILLMAAGLGYLLLQPAPESSRFATMASTNAAIWASGDLPTAEGARLGEGQLRLREGLATLHFDSGAEVTLEAPAELKLVDSMNCQLLSGTAVTDVPESAIGFRIETPSAKVVDHGTRFVVNVDEASGATKTQVLEGMVEVEHPQTQKVVRLEAGQRNYAAGDRVEPASDSPEEGTWTEPLPQIRRGPDWRILTTGQQRGQDAYVASSEITEHTSDVLLLVKNTAHAKGPIRKAYLQFDLGTLDRSRISSAELVLHFYPTGWGLASVVPDSDFTVYGLTQETLDDWTSGSLTWENAPANVRANGDLKRDAIHKLGTFTLGAGVQRGQFGIQGEELATFLREDGNDLATLIVIRETLENEGGGLVHGFASSRHPFLPAPTLAIQLATE